MSAAWLPIRGWAYMSAPDGATWRSGYATVCKTVYSGSIPDVASIHPINGLGRLHEVAFETFSVSRRRTSLRETEPAATGSGCRWRGAAADSGAGSGPRNHPPEWARWPF